MAANINQKREKRETIMKANLHELALELLARDWLKPDSDPGLMLYLTDKVLPVLVLSIEQLLVTVSRRGLEEQEGFREDFNPVNFLAEYLMRHNPRYPQVHKGPGGSRYYTGLKEV